MAKKNENIVIVPRVLAMLYVLFIFLFALKIFYQGLDLNQALSMFWIALIPCAILIVLTMVAWKMPKTGGFLFILLGAVYLYFNPTRFHIGAALPMFIIGFLFVVLDWLKKYV